MIFRLTHGQVRDAMCTRESGMSFHRNQPWCGWTYDGSSRMAWYWSLDSLCFSIAAWLLHHRICLRVISRCWLYGCCHVWFNRKRTNSGWETSYFHDGLSDAKVCGPCLIFTLCTILAWVCVIKKVCLSLFLLQIWDRNVENVHGGW